MAKMSKPKILFVSHNHPAVRPGGAEGYAFDLYETIRAGDDFEPILLARTGPPHSPIRQYHEGRPFTMVTADTNQYFMYTDLSHYDWFHGRSADKTTLTRFFRDFLLAQKPDVVHFQHTLFIGYDIIRVTRNTLPDVPIVYTLHEYLPICNRDGQMVRTRGRELCQEESPRRCNECFPDVSPQMFFARKRFVQSHFSLVDFFIVPDEYARQRYIDWGIPPEKIQTEPYGKVPVSTLDGDRAARPRNRFAFFGQFTPYKGMDVLLKAMRELGDDFDGHLWLHGANIEFHPGDFKREFQELIDATAKTVTLAGSYDQSDLPFLMANTDWVVVPSIWWETGPLVVLEAFQHGRPVICSDIGGMSVKVRDGESGLHFHRDDHHHLAQVMLRAANAPELWNDLHSHIPPVHSMSDHIAVLSAVYERLLAGRGAGRRGKRTAQAAARDA